MRTLVCVLAVYVAVPGATGQAGQEKKGVDPAKLLGYWEPADVKGENPPLALPVEFLKTGQVAYGGADVENWDTWGSYKVVNGRLEVTEKVKGKEVTHRFTIEKISDTDLVLSHDDGKKKWTLRRPKK